MQTPANLGILRGFFFLLHRTALQITRLLQRHLQRVAALRRPVEMLLSDLEVMFHGHGRTIPDPRADDLNREIFRQFRFSG
ncbi:MAG: hypothetical protein ACLP9L_14700 [Thermoguttaceae bacterium]